MRHLGPLRKLGRTEPPMLLMQPGHQQTPRQLSPLFADWLA
jgi:hypothetical protein